jgi:hypothetical protein
MNGINSLLQALHGPGYQPIADDGMLQSQLDQISGQAQQAGSNAFSTLRQQLSSQPAAYTNQFAAPQVAANPLAQYMQAGGVSDQGVQALRDMLGASSAASTAADQRTNDMMAASAQRANQSRMNDVNQMEASFNTDLANNKAAAGSVLARNRQNYMDGIAQKNLDRQDQLRQQILQLAINGHLDLSKLGIQI